jgi:hypothetical protein
MVIGFFRGCHSFTGTASLPDEYYDWDEDYSPVRSLSQSRGAPEIGQQNVAVHYLTDSRRRMAIHSKSITAFFKFIASSK